MTLLSTSIRLQTDAADPQRDRRSDRLEPDDGVVKLSEEFPGETSEMLTHLNIRIGCSGWQYRHWRNDFYPPNLPQSRWLEHYATVFDTVEVNNTFYRLPEMSTFAAWKGRVPRRFLFALKASRYLTHMKKLKDPKEPLALFLSRARALGRTFGPILYQLPPRWPLTAASVERFDRFLRALSRRRLHAIEFRDPSWYDDDVFARIEQHGAALCLHDMHGSATGRRSVGSFVYVRFHGVQKYSGRYRDEALDEWASWLSARTRQGIPIFAYFNNDAGGHAPRDAMRLRRCVARKLQVATLKAQ